MDHRSALHILRMSGKQMCLFLFGHITHRTLYCCSDLLTRVHDSMWGEHLHKQPVKYSEHH